MNGFGNVKMDSWRIFKESNNTARHPFGRDEVNKSHSVFSSERAASKRIKTRFKWNDKF